MEEITKWVEFDEIKVRGQLSYIKGGPRENHRIQITSDIRVQFTRLPTIVESRQIHRKVVIHT